MGGEAKMDECLRDCMKKLSLWHTKTFKPIMNHEELEPIMAKLGFVAQPPRQPIAETASETVWREYVYVAGAARGGLLMTMMNGSGMSTAVEEEEKRRRLEMPLPMLPYPRIDGLHIYTYRAFIDAVDFYLDVDDISDIFHVRGMPIHRTLDRKQKFHRMGDEESFLVFREGTLEQRTFNLYHSQTPNLNNNSSNKDDHINTSSRSSCNVIRNKGRGTSVGNFVQLKDIVLWLPPSVSRLSLDSSS